MNRLAKFWDENKNTIKTVIIAVAVPLAAVALHSVTRMNKIIDSEGLNDMFYEGDTEE